MVLSKNAQELPLADMEKSSEQEEAKGRTFTDERRRSKWAKIRFINADFSATLDSLRGTELPPMHLTNAVTWEFNDNDYFAQIM